MSQHLDDDTGARVVVVSVRTSQTVTPYITCYQNTMPQKQIAGKSTNQQPDLVATSVFMAFERPNKIFPTVFENTVEPL